MSFCLPFIVVSCVLFVSSVFADDYTSIGCFTDRSSRAISTLEGKDSRLDGGYTARANAIQKCATVARSKGYECFAVQNGGWCASSPIACDTYDKYGASSNCAADGEGGPWANHVYRLNSVSREYTTLGCYKDTGTRAIPTLEGTDSRLNGGYGARTDAIKKCAEVARDHGYECFAVQNGGWCASGPNACDTYDKYGAYTTCKTDGEGGAWGNQVYKFTTKPTVPDREYTSLGCFKDTGTRAIATLEGKDSRLDGTYQSRTDAIKKCAEVAKDRGYECFAVQNGGWCAGSFKACETYDKYGPYTTCLGDGEGGPWGNEVYRFKTKPPMPVVDFTYVGCYKDQSSRAVSTLEGKDSRLDGGYTARANAIQKCADAARSKGYECFAVQNGGWCASSPIACDTYDKYGPSDKCLWQGAGGPWANAVYRLKSVTKDYNSLGCYKDTATRAIPTLEGTDSRLNGGYTARTDAIKKCAEVARDHGYECFAVQNGGWCASGPNACDTYDKYGAYTTCRTDGEGGPWGNQVYKFGSKPTVVDKDYTDLGCFKDTGVRAIPTMENGDPRLDGNYLLRTDAIEKCAEVAYDNGFECFAVQNGGWCAGSPTACDTYDKYGDSATCKGDGEGGPWGNQVYKFNSPPPVPEKKYTSIGCFKDTGARAIPTIEGTDYRLMENYGHRLSAIKKCSDVARSLGYECFAVQNGGWCAAGPMACETYDKYGPSTACKDDGEGGPWANHVYRQEVTCDSYYESVGCFKDTGTRAIPTLEGTDSRLDGGYGARKNALLKCAQVAQDRGFKYFAVQNGGWCAGSANAGNYYDQYGPSTACKDDGEGGPWANHVYTFP